MGTSHCPKCCAPMLASYSVNEDLILFRCNNCDYSYTVGVEDVLKAEKVMLQIIARRQAENENR